MQVGVSRWQQKQAMVRDMYANNKSTPDMNHEQKVMYDSTLQHTSTCFNTVQRTATHCNTLQHTATCCTTQQLHPRFEPRTDVRPPSAVPPLKKIQILSHLSHVP